MAFVDIRDFLEVLEKRGDLVRVTEPVSTYLEMTEIQRRLLQQKGPAVIFENPVSKEGVPYDMPVVANIFGTEERVALAMGKTRRELRQFGETLSKLQQPRPPGSLKEAFSMLPLLSKALHMRPKIVKKSPAYETVFEGSQVDLRTLPIQTCWPKDIAPLITWGLVVTQGSQAETAQEKPMINVGVYRLQLLGKNKLIVRWLRHRGGAQHFQSWKEKQKQTEFPVAVVIGADPAAILAGVTPIPDDLSEYAFAGLFKGERLSLTACRTIDLHVPASAEIVLEGTLNLEERALEGPYGDHTGYYNEQEYFPVLTVKAMAHRKSPYYLTTFTGRAPDEPATLAQSLNDVFVPLLQKQFNEIVDFYMPPETCSYRVGIIKIKKRYPGQARRVMMGVWSFLRQFLYTKILIVVDEDISIQSWEDVMWAVATRSDPVRDTMLLSHTPMDYLDFASPVEGLGGKMGIDATHKIGSETNRQWGEKLEMTDDIKALVSQQWERYGFSSSKLK